MKPLLLLLLIFAVAFIGCTSYQAHSLTALESRDIKSYPEIEDMEISYNKYMTLAPFLLTLLLLALLRFVFLARSKNIREHPHSLTSAANRKETFLATNAVPRESFKAAPSFTSLKAKVIGKRGEEIVRSILKSSLDHENYRILNDLTIPRNSYPNPCVINRNSQIDHIVLSIYGIFVIETKNYSGWIFGHANQREWIGVYYQRQYRFQNPIKQNWSHIYALSKLLNISKKNSIILFVL